MGTPLQPACAPRQSARTAVTPSPAGLTRTIAVAGMMLLFLTAFGLAEQEGEWNHFILWDGGEKIQGVAFGDADPDRNGVEGVAVSLSGAVGIGGLSGSSTWSEVIYHHTDKLNTALIADLDPLLPGNELYLGGGDGGKGGEVLQAHKADGKWTVRSIWKGDGFVHAFGILPPAREGGIRELVIPTYSGKIIALSPSGANLWAEHLLHRESPEGDSARLLLKDLVTGGAGGMNGRYVFFVSKAGRGVLLDADRPGFSQVVHVEKGGIARVDMDPQGTIYGACNSGNVLKISREGEAWRVDTLYRDINELRGVGCGRFPTRDGVNPLAIFGYSGFVRALFPGFVGWDSHTLFRDIEKAHSLDVADVIPGNDADEILIGGYSGRLILLAAASGSKRKEGLK